MNLSLHVMRQVANAIGLLFAVLVLNFCLIHAAPGDPITSTNRLWI
jgi:peptide/nickel transport system permease protein